MMDPENNTGRYGHLSAPSEEWKTVSERQKLLDKMADELYSLPIREIRQIPYRPAPLPAHAPAVGRDLSIWQSSVAVSDETMITIRIYQPAHLTRGHPLYFNIHGGGETLIDLTPFSGCIVLNPIGRLDSWIIRN